MLHDCLKLDPSGVEVVNQFLTDPGNRLAREALRIVEKYGTPAEINDAARRARDFTGIMNRLQIMKSPYYADLLWLMAERDKGSFVTISDFRRSVLEELLGNMCFDETRAVTLEISALQYFPWLIAEARQAIECREIMPGRYIRVRKMKEQEADNGDLLAIVAAMQIVGATWVETLDTKGTDGSNVHLGGPETITGYFGGNVSEPTAYGVWKGIKAAAAFVFGDPANCRREKGNHMGSHPDHGGQTF